MWFENISKELLILVDLLVSVILGFFIGLERKNRLKEAGIRTHTIVCLGSALMMSLSLNAFGENSDTGRVAAQIVSGIGFLGAGMIIYKKNAVKGLTTAAGVWASAGIGMACGARMYILATGAAFIMIAVQCILHIKCRLFRMKKHYTVRVEFIYTDRQDEYVKKLFGVAHYSHFVVTRDGDKLIYKATMNTTVEPPSAEINEILSKHDFILKIERGDAD